MSIIPVLDLMIGQVVLAQGGNRDAYLPVHSRLTTSSRPLEVAQAIFNQTGCDWLYLADIDSFAGAAPNWNVYRELLDRGFGLWLDADWLTNDRYLDITNQLNPERLKVIISSETISSREQFSVFPKLIESGLTPIFSLDKKGDAVVSQSDWLTSATALSPYELVQLAYQQGVRDLIVLDLAEVGTSNGFQAGGSSALLIESIKQELQDIRIASGGGVRNPGDVRQWIDAGCDHVLVASAIHAGAFTPDDVTQL
jgi:phosphoribosylformimino-5-aminoimidazole carboxamide ribotide isomerase